MQVENLRYEKRPVAQFSASCHIVNECDTLPAQGQVAQGGKEFTMSLPIEAPFAPMDALLTDEIPIGDEWEYEPKWDGFRCLVFREGNKLQLQSKSGQSLTRYFPELTSEFLRFDTDRFVLDGEIAIPVGTHFSFDDLLQRIHPAESRVQKLSREHPAVFIAFDLLVAPGGLSRWSTKRSMEWQPLRPELVVEVSYDHFTGGRFRHGTKLIRWRPDKDPKQCRMDQVGPTGKGAWALLSN